MIEARELRKSFGSLKAVDGVSFEVGKGETFGLLGPNGAGKSTTINMLVGALKPDSGEVVIDGRRAFADVSARMKLGVAPQAIALYDDLTAAENLAFFATMYGLSGPNRARRVDVCLEFAGLTDRRNDRVGAFSGGMKRRLNLAAALIHEPQVLLLDEPTAGVDPQSRNHIFDRIESLKKNDVTVIYTTHYMEEAERLCDRVAIMDHGKILDVDTVPGLVRNHGGMSRIVAELVQPPENLDGLEGDLQGTTLRVDTKNPHEDLVRIVRSNLEIRELRMESANLETVFLNLTGRSLRD